MVFYEEVIFDADLSISVKPQQYAQISICSAIGIYMKGEVFPLVFCDSSILQLDKFSRFIFKNFSTFKPLMLPLHA